MDGKRAMLEPELDEEKTAKFWLLLDEVIAGLDQLPCFQWMKKGIPMEPKVLVKICSLCGKPSKHDICARPTCKNAYMLNWSSRKQQKENPNSV